MKWKTRLPKKKGHYIVRTETSMLRQNRMEVYFNGKKWGCSNQIVKGWLDESEVMKKSHRDVMDKLEEYFSQEGSQHLRFFQGLRNCNLIEYHTVDTGIHLDTQIVDDYNIEDSKLIKRIKL